MHPTPRTAGEADARPAGARGAGPSAAHAHGAFTGVAQSRPGFTPVREVEMLKAIRSLAKKKAPGADALPSEVFQRLTGALPALTLLASAIIRTGTLPMGLREVGRIPLDKKGENPHLCES